MLCLVACEESQEITKQLRFLGHTAFSCDLKACSGGFPEWHIIGDCLKLINGDCEFMTENGIYYNFLGCKWDLIIGHPPCTYLSCAGNRHFSVEKYGDKAIERIKLRESAADFFMQMWNCDCSHVALENPVGYMNSRFRKPDQIINPFQFGDNDRKRTCLWLRGLPLLVPDYVRPAPEPLYYRNGKAIYFTEGVTAGDRQSLRSKTFPGVARAMAYQFTCNFFVDML